MNEWQPIETAPLDGTRVLLFRYLAPWFITGWGYWIRGIGWRAHGFFDPPGDLGLNAPTHWKPIALVAPR